MKLVHFTLLFLSFSAGCAANPQPLLEVGSASEALTKNALTRAQSKTALSLIDRICGDTWCDGDYDFGFRKLSCNKRGKTCTLTLQVFPREGVPTTRASYWRSCKTGGFTGFASLVTTAPSGYQALQDDYYSALTECISSIEAKLPKPAGVSFRARRQSLPAYLNDTLSLAR